MELMIIRHGESVADVEGRHEGRADFPLTALGRRQSSLLVTWLARTLPPERIWSSPLQRAAELAAVLAAEIGTKVHYHDGLMEWNNGILAGMLASEAAVKFPKPAVPRRLHERIPQGESELEFRTRVEATFSELMHDSGPDARLAIVTHGGTITMLYRAFLGLPLQTNVWLASGDTGVHHWSISAGMRVVRLSNSTEHLRVGG